MNAFNIYMTAVTKNIYLGSLDDAFDEHVKCQVSHMLNVAEELNLLDRVDHIYTKIAVVDDDMTVDIRIIFDECIRFIDCALESGGSILIHCLEGKSRSVCVCLVYLCIRYGMHLNKALQIVKEKRPCIDIFPLYLEQLSLYLDQAVVLS